MKSAINSLWLIIFFISVHSSVFSQQKRITGTVYDATTKAPLAFVSISLKNTSTGTVSDIDGKFTFNNLPDKSILVFSYTGYHNKEISLSNSSLPLEFFLNQNNQALENVVITPGENPAFRIIRLVQANKKQNNPDQLPSYKYNAYTVSAVGSGEHLWNMNRRPVDSAKQKQSKPNPRDTANLRQIGDVVKKLVKNYLFVTESYTERIFKYPNQTKETTIATKASGMKSPLFSLTSSNFQPFGFYQDYLQILDKPYVNPLINGSLSMYQFKLQEVQPHESDTTFIISFKPRKGKLFNGMKGLLYISSNGYAIENVTATAAEEKGLIMRFRIQQKYERAGTQWFPAQLNSTVSQFDVVADSSMVFWDSRSYISNTSIGIPLAKSAFSDVSQEMAPQAGNKTEQEWSNFRTDSLKPKEKITYEAYQQLPPKVLNGIDKFNNILEAAALQAIPWGKVDIPFKYFISGTNQYEKFRLGAGFQTNTLFHKVISFGGFAGYGMGDKAFKYGGNLLLRLQGRTATSLQLSYALDLAEPGNTDYFIRNSSVFSNQALRYFYTSRLDSIQQYRVDFSTKIRPFFQTDLWLLNELRNPAGYNYFYNNNNAVLRQYRNTEMGIGIRITVGETYTKIGRAKTILKPARTELLLQAAQGLDHLLNGSLHYTKLALQFNHSFKLKRLGETSIQLEAGEITGDVPYAYLFNAKASYHKGVGSFYIPNTFQTVRLYEFAADKTASLFIRHSFGNLLFKPSNLHFRPEPVLIQGICYGSLRNASFHKNIDIIAPEKGLFESGLQLKNIYRMNMQFMYLGIGAGIFYRYGTYSLPKASQNWAFKFGLDLSF